MTAPGNPEQQSSDGTRNDGRAEVPPWQRVGEQGTTDHAVVSGTAAGSVFAGENPSSDSPTRDAQADERSGGPAMNLGEVRGGSGEAPSALRRPGRGPRRANLQVRRFDPWSVLKLSLVFGVTLFFIWLVAVGALYVVLDGMSVWDKINGTYTSLVEGAEGSTAPDELITPLRVFGISAVVGAINIVLLSALATVSAFIYNVCADMAGGLELTLSERE